MGEVCAPCRPFLWGAFFFPVELSTAHQPHDAKYAGATVGRDTSLGQDGRDERCGHPGDGMGDAPGVLRVYPSSWGVGGGTEVQPPGHTASISKPDVLASRGSLLKGKYPLPRTPNEG